MLSILPKHVADEMLKDMKKDESQKDQQQFNTMYMYRHENVRCAGSQSRVGGASWRLSSTGGFKTLPADGKRDHPWCGPQPCRSSLLTWRAEKCSRLCGPIMYRRHAEQGTGIWEVTQALRDS